MEKINQDIKLHLLKPILLKIKNLKEGISSIDVPHLNLHEFKSVAEFRKTYDESVESLNSRLKELEVYCQPFFELTQEDLTKLSETSILELDKLKSQKLNFIKEWIFENPKVSSFAEYAKAANSRLINHENYEMLSKIDNCNKSERELSKVNYSLYQKVGLSYYDEISDKYNKMSSTVAKYASAKSILELFEESRLINSNLRQEFLTLKNSLEFSREELTSKYKQRLKSIELKFNQEEKDINELSIINKVLGDVADSSNLKLQFYKLCFAGNNFYKNLISKHGIIDLTSALHAAESLKNTNGISFSLENLYCRRSIKENLLSNKIESLDKAIQSCSSLYKLNLREVNSQQNQGDEVYTDHLEKLIVYSGIEKVKDELIGKVLGNI